MHCTDKRVTVHTVLLQANHEQYAAAAAARTRVGLLLLLLLLRCRCAVLLRCCALMLPLLPLPLCAAAVAAAVRCCSEKRRAVAARSCGTRWLCTATRPPVTSASPRSIAALPASSLADESQDIHSLDACHAAQPPIVVIGRFFEDALVSI